MVFYSRPQVLARITFFKKSALFSCLVILLFGTQSALAQSAASAAKSSQANSDLNDPATEARVEELLKQMTLEEKVGQLVQYSAGQPTGPGTGRTDYADMLTKGEIGALFNIVTAKETNQFQRVAVEKSRLHIPVIFGLDIIHGFRTEFPIPLGISATWDPLLAERAARVAAREASATGIRWTFSPMVDIARDPRWGRIAEGNGEDPFLGSAFARAYVRGYQGNHLNNSESILACVKHYVGYGAAEAGREYNSTEISEHTLREYYLPPFHAAVNAGAGSLMSAFNSLNGVPASANSFTLKKILKQEWGFRGLVDSDWTSVAELMNHGIANDGATAAKKAFLAGVDMDMVSSLYHDHLAKLVQSGEVPQSDLDDAVRRVLRVKFALGLFENPYADEKKETPAMLLPESVELSREIAERSFVLLKNDPLPSGTPLLPLGAEVKSVALIGPLADDAQDMLGSWGAQGRAEDVVTLRKSLVERLGESRVHYAKGSEMSTATDAQIKAAVEAAKNSDVVILALGENGTQMTGEAASRCPSRSSRPPAAITRSGRCNRKARCAHSVQWPLAHSSLGFRARSRGSCCVVSRRSSGACTRTHFVRRKCAERKAFHHLAAQRRTNSHLLQRTQHGPPCQTKRNGKIRERRRSKISFRAISTNRISRYFHLDSASATPLFVTAPRNWENRNCVWIRFVKDCKTHFLQLLPRCKPARTSPTPEPFPSRKRRNSTFGLKAPAFPCLCAC